MKAAIAFLPGARADVVVILSLVFQLYNFTPI
jgi:hypothetical protein